MIKRALSGTSLQVDLQGSQGYALIDHITGIRRFATKPDIVISREGKRLLIIDTKWKRLKGEMDDVKRGVGQADVYQMMAYAHVYDSNLLMLLYPHHDELPDGEGIQTLHRIADKQESRPAVATVTLSDHKSLGWRLRKLLFEKTRRSLIWELSSCIACRVMTFASACAAFTCGRAGADPPPQADVGAELSRLLPG
jgi:5-methylcytosine-specific restriction enzyme subunit McrC